ncbi:MAG: 2-oxoacid:acceptor oxidoreductase family protein [Endomicrobium sp.]|jgi:2-oxoglutarate ferredoxin oxidoreductase subunit gamma|nr:2-oxoacid:acceptor oxidoreductase family protein [Endomicrobium sp.]
MQNKIIIAGFGGQGVLIAGILIAQTAIEEGLHTTWFPSYGAEMRGGTANSTVIVSSDEIGSPVVPIPNILIALNEISLSKFMPKITNEALLTIANSSITSQNNKRNPKFYSIPITDIADKTIKNLKTVNMVAVGLLIKLLEKHTCNSKNMKEKDKKPLHLESALRACEKVFESKQQLVDINKKAIQTGYNFIK